MTGNIKKVQKKLSSTSRLSQPEIADFVYPKMLRALNTTLSSYVNKLSLLKSVLFVLRDILHNINEATTADRYMAVMLSVM